MLLIIQYKNGGLTHAPEGHARKGVDEWPSVQSFRLTERLKMWMPWALAHGASLDFNRKDAYRMKRFYYLLVILVLAVIITIGGCLFRDREVLFQVSTIDTLLEGVYDGEVTFGELATHGDFGIGTFDHLDGEMIGLDGRFYQVKYDGKVYPAKGDMTTPFAVVTFFDADKQVFLDKELDFEALEGYLDSLIPTENIFYAVRIDGTFKYIKARSVPRQEKPYPPLLEVTKKQSIFEFNDVEGTIVGFRSPSYVKGINVPGYHLHFITKDRSGGGHLLACRTAQSEIRIDNTSKFFMVLSEREEFLRADLAKDKQAELEKIEK